MDGLCLWYKHMPSKLRLNYANSIMMAVLRFREMGLVNNGAYNVNKTIATWVLIYMLFVDRVAN